MEDRLAPTVIPAKAGIQRGMVHHVRKKKLGYVYILASKRNGTLYTGVTSNLVRRVHEHKQGHGSEFTAEHGVHRLVYCDALDDPAVPAAGEILFYFVTAVDGGSGESDD